MRLTSGTQLGPYEIIAPLGAGGMGEVYRAKDTRLDRTVAVKILPTHLSDNPAAKQRFEREARTISSLNHPHICVLHDVGSEAGIAYLVMEYVQGETLACRLQKGPLPLKQALEYGIQICDALEKAHRAGIVHRDLKPGNIMLTASGVKLLDFGLAKAAGALDPHALIDQSTPTLSLPALSAPPDALTQQGALVGTLPYMAPELLHRQEADARSDLFSFGCVLYEMIAGRRAFDAKSQLILLTTILEKDPEPLVTVQPNTPPALDYTVQTCLEKSPDNRFQAAHDVKLNLMWIAKTGSPPGAPEVVTNARKARALRIAAVAVLAVAVIALAAGWWTTRLPRRVLRLNILPPEATRFETMYRNGPPALSPDGTRVAFVASRDGKSSLWLRSLDQLEATPLRGTDGAYFPFWSPQGGSLAFFMNGKLWRMGLGGGAPVAICEAPEGRGGTWGRGNVILFAPRVGGPIFQVAAEGGKPRPATDTPASAEVMSDRWPFFLPDGRHFLYLHSPLGAASDRNEIRFASLDGDGARVLLRGRYYTVQYASGWLLSDHRGSLQAWKLDPARGKISGDAIELADKIASDDVSASAVFSVSQPGILLYQQGSGSPGSTGERHVWVDRSGKQLAEISAPGVYGATRLSPDGSRVATPVVAQNGDTSIWMWDLAGGTRARLSSGDGFADTPVWSADRRTIYFAYPGPNGHQQIQEVPADGSRSQRSLITADSDLSAADSSNDGNWLLYEETKRDDPQLSLLKAFPLAPGLKPFTVLEPVASLSNARLKPGSNDWLAYQSSESGRSEVYLTKFPRAGAKYQVSPAGGSQPVWGKDGKRLYYLDDSHRITTVDVQTANDSVQVGPPKTLFPTGVRTSISAEGYDVTRDGRFLVVNSVTQNTAPVILVMNWEAGLKK